MIDFTKEWLLNIKPQLDKRAYSGKIINYLKNLTFGNVLDVGTGCGSALDYLVNDVGININGQIFAVDIDEELLNCCRERFQRGEGQTVLQSAIVKNMSVYHLTYNFGENYFDFVVAQALLEHVDKDRALGQIYRVLKPGGLFYASQNTDRPTFFEPELSPLHRDIEDRIIKNFLEKIDETGDSYCGRRLYHACKKAGFEVLIYDAEDWILYKEDYPNYPKIASYLIEWFYRENQSLINDTIPDEMLKKKQIENLNKWRELRLEHIKNGIMVYSCKQNGILCRKV